MGNSPSELKLCRWTSRTARRLPAASPPRWAAAPPAEGAAKAWWGATCCQLVATGSENCGTGGESRPRSSRCICISARRPQRALRGMLGPIPASCAGWEPCGAAKSRSWVYTGFYTSRRPLQARKPGVAGVPAAWRRSWGPFSRRLHATRVVETPRYHTIKLVSSSVGNFSGAEGRGHATSSPTARLGVVTGHVRRCLLPRCQPLPYTPGGCRPLQHVRACRVSALLCLQRSHSGGQRKAVGSDSGVWLALEALNNKARELILFARPILKNYDMMTMLLNPVTLRPKSAQKAPKRPLRQAACRRHSSPPMRAAGRQRQRRPDSGLARMDEPKSTALAPK